jgi:hypothetical protein
MAETGNGNDIITEISGMDSRRRISAKSAASEIVRAGQPLFDIVFDTAVNSHGHLPERCAEACARAALANSCFAEKRAGEIVVAILKKPEGRIRYFLAVLAGRLAPCEKDAYKCAHIINEWLHGEKSRGAKAAFLEAIAGLYRYSKRLEPMAEKLINEALQSPVPSYSARARQIIKRKGNVPCV